jgi:hypothetical protein
MGNHLPAVHWNSAVNSGDIRVFCSKQRIQLSEVYFAIQCYNYEAERASRIRDQKKLTVDKLAGLQAQRAWASASEVTRRYGKTALDKLQVLTKEKWFQDP